VRTFTLSVHSICGLLAAFISTFMASDVFAQDVDLVVNITSDQPAYMAQDLQSFSVTISNNGPDTATSVELIVEHPVAELPFELSATCQALPGANPNGPAVCPPGSGTAPSPAFVRSGQTFSVTVPQIPALSEARIDFETEAHCPPADGPIGEPACFGVPTGNFTISADVSAAESESNTVTNSTTTNVFLFPPDVQYAVEIVSAPATATPGSVVEYEFEVSSFGLQPSDLLDLKVEIRGEAGTMIPLSASNHPIGAAGSTLPNTELLAIDCISVSLGTYPIGSVFPATPAPWQTCPTTGLIPIPTPVSPTNTSPVTGFPNVSFLQDLPGTLDGPPGGGVMRFKADVLVGDPVCVDEPDSGVRDLVFEFSVQGLQGTDLVAPGPADNIATVVTEVPGNCEVADIEFTTAGVPASPTLDGNGEASWVHEVTVTNLSAGPSAGRVSHRFLAGHDLADHLLVGQHGRYQSQRTGRSITSAARPDIQSDNPTGTTTVYPGCQSVLRQQRAPDRGTSQRPDDLSGRCADGFYRGREVRTFCQRVRCRCRHTVDRPDARYLHPRRHRSVLQDRGDQSQYGQSRSAG